MIQRCFVAMCLLCGYGLAQAPGARPPVGAIASHPDWPKAKASDVDTIEHILAAIDAVISGPGKSPRDWDRYRSLFVPDARLIPVRAMPAKPEASAAPPADLLFYAVDDYASRFGPHLADQDFYERVTHTEVEEYGNIVQVFATFESRHEPNDKEPFDSGVDSYQLLKDGGRYWIVSLYYNLRKPAQSIPVRYLPSSGPDATRLNQNLTGEWVGQLEYRDFRTDERTFLPTWLRMTPGTDGRSVVLEYVYDDGPTKTVRETSTLVVNPDGKKATLGPGKDHAGDTYAVAGLEEFVKANRGTLVLTGSGKENDKPVDVRLTITLRRNLFTLVKETRSPGAEFKFRDGYTFTRKTAPEA